MIRIFIALCIFASTAEAITQAQLIERTRALVSRQKAELDDAKAKLKSAQTTNQALNQELDAKQKEFEATVKKWVDYGDEQHRQVVAVTTQRDHLLKKLHTTKWIISLLAAAAAVLAVLNLPIPMPYKLYALAGAPAISTAIVWIFL